MGLWSLYFLGKLYLDFRGYLRLDFVLNLLFVVFLAVPLPKRLRPYTLLTTFRFAVSVVLALLLFWHDSFLPSPGDSLAFVRQDGIPSKEYVLRFFLGFFNPVETASLALLLLGGYLIRKHVRLTAVVIALLLLVPLRGLGQQNKGMVDRYVDAFYHSEAKRAVQLNPLPGGALAFDIIILHICSLSWDDLNTIGMADDPFLKQFDVLFTKFDSVTSYSNPAALRLLRATCGQMRHDDISGDVPRTCELFDALRGMGYQTYFTMNHDGTYSNFSGQVKELAHLDPPLLPAGLPVEAANFDGAPIYDDYQVLDRWWETRQSSGAARAAVYYNTITLHDGAHWANDADWWKRDRTALYTERVRKLFADLSRFIDRVALSGRNAVVLFVPEHGMALRGTTLQVPGLRDIPLPQITIVPVGVKWIGNEFRAVHDHPRVVLTPTSYLALSYLLAATFKQTTAPSASSPLEEAADNVPETAYLSENQGARVAKVGADYFMYGKEKKWIPLPTEALN